MSTSPKGSATARMVSSVMSVGTLAGFFGRGEKMHHVGGFAHLPADLDAFGQRRQQLEVVGWRAHSRHAQTGLEAQLLRERRSGVSGGHFALDSNMFASARSSASANFSGWSNMTKCRAGAIETTSRFSIPPSNAR